jgi:hypothetical protein
MAILLSSRFSMDDHRCGLCFSGEDGMGQLESGEERVVHL